MVAISVQVGEGITAEIIRDYLRSKVPRRKKKGINNEFARI